MDDDKLKSLFSEFKPELSSDFQFMNKLQKNLNSVEIIKRHSAEVKQRNKRAVVIAAIVGFIVGCLFSLSVPYICEAVSNRQLILPADSVLNTIADNFITVAWIIVAGTSVLAALNTYEISLSLLKRDIDSSTDKIDDHK